MSRHSRDPLVWVSLAAGVGFTATAEYELARTIGAEPPVAVLLPLALDVYVIAAIRRSRGRDIALSLVLMGTAQIAAHLLVADVVGVSVPLVAAVSLLVPLSIWRVHALAVLTPSPDPVPAAPAGPAALPRLVAVPVPVPATGPAALPRLVPVPVAGESRPELTAVPARADSPVPVRPRRRTSTPTTKKTARGTAPKAGTASFDEHVRTATEWLAKEPDLSGTAIGTRLGTGDSYGRRVKRAAVDGGTGTPAPGRERPAESMEGGYA